MSDHDMKLSAKFFCDFIALKSINVKKKTVVTATNDLITSMECLDNPNYIIALIAVCATNHPPEYYNNFYLIYKDKMYIMKQKKDNIWGIKQQTAPKSVIRSIIPNDGVKDITIRYGLNLLILKSICNGLFSQ